MAPLGAYPGEKGIMKKTTPRINDKTAEFLTENFKSLNAGCEFTLELMYHLYRKEMHDMKGAFTRDELMLIIDLFNGHALNPESTGTSFWWHITEGIKYDYLDEKWGVKKEDMQKKAEALNSFQTACLEIWASGFWYGGDRGKGLDIEKYVEEALK